MLPTSTRKRKALDEDNDDQSSEISVSLYPKESFDFHKFWARFCTYLMEHEDASYLAPFRIMWGLVMFKEVYHLLEDNQVSLISKYYLNPYNFQFKYFMFSWVVAMEYEFMIIFLIIMVIASIGITIGFKYRICATIFFFGVSYLFLLEVTNYLNHMYLVCVMSFILIFFPCDRIYSVDAWRNPNIRVETVPKIYLAFIRVFIIIVYMYAGIVKINEDWLRAEPLRHWVGIKGNTIFGDRLNYESTAYFMSYGGLIYDLSVGFLLLYGKTFWIGFALSLFFHGTNRILFHIGIFPFVMIATTSLFFDPDWFRRLLHFIKRKKTPLVPVAPVVTFNSIKPRKLTKKEKYAIYIAIGFLIFWLLFPSRNLLYKGSVAWNEHGHQYSWRMKLRDKHCHADFFLFMPDSKTLYEPPSPSILLSPIQSRKFVHRPWTLIEYAYFLSDLFGREGETPPEVYSYCSCQLNYRPRQQYIDPKVDLASLNLNDYPDIVTELEPLTDEAKMLFPWNWKWNFNWLWGINDGSNRDKIRQESKERGFDDRKATEENKLKFREWMGERLNRTVEQLPLNPLNPPKPTNKIAAKYWKQVDDLHEELMEKAIQDALNKAKQ